MSPPGQGSAAFSSQQAITDIEGRIKLLGTLASALAKHGTQPDTVLQALECILDLRKQIVKVHGRQEGKAEMLPTRRVNAAEVGPGRERRPRRLAG